MTNSYPNTDYQLAIDDSGGIEPLITRTGQFVPGDHPFAMATSVLVRTDLMSRLDVEWLRLRQDIQAFTGAPDLPPIHLRIMTGQSRPPTYRKKPNPYFGVDIQKILDWAEQGTAILDALAREPRGLLAFTYNLNRADNARPLVKAYSDPAFLAEAAFIKKHSVKPFPKLYQKFHVKTASILIPALVYSFAYADENLRQAVFKTAHVHVDPFDDSSGVDSAAVLDALTRMTELKHLRGFVRVPDSDDSSLIQAADLVGYWFFRNELSKSRKQPLDAFSAHLFEKYYKHWKPMTSANISHIVNRKFGQNRPGLFTLHYMLAYQAMHEYHPEFCEKYLVTPDEFLQRVKQAAKPGYWYVPVLQDLSISGIKL